MKKFILILIMLNATFTVKAQSNFAPLGATWTYQCWTVFGGGPLCQGKSIGDTVITNKNCRIIEFECSYLYKCGRQFMYSDSGKVFFWDTDRSIFQQLYNINATVGDKFSFMPDNYSNDSIVNLVDSITSITINGNSLKVLYVHTIHKPSYIKGGFGKIIENIGNTYYMFPWTLQSNAEGYTGNLACYSDSYIGFYDFGIIPNCASGLRQESFLNSVSIFPNPTKGEITITPKIDNVTITIYNLFGQIVYDQKNYKNKNESLSIDLSIKAKGIYFLKLQTKNSFLVKKIIVE